MRGFMFLKGVVVVRDRYSLMSVGVVECQVCFFWVRRGWEGRWVVLGLDGRMGGGGGR